MYKEFATWILLDIYTYVQESTRHFFDASINNAGHDVQTIYD